MNNKSLSHTPSHLWIFSLKVAINSFLCILLENIFFRHKKPYVNVHKWDHGICTVLTCPWRSFNMNTFRSNPLLVKAPKYLIVKISYDACNKSTVAGYLCEVAAPPVFTYLRNLPLWAYLFFSHLLTLLHIHQLPAYSSYSSVIILLLHKHSSA